MPNSATFAKALIALHAAGLLNDPACKPAVKTFIRQASEDRHWHFSAHYRSRSAAELIMANRPKTKAQYQAFCRKNLRHEHMVPGEVVYQLLIAMKRPSLASITKLLQNTSFRATITKSEDRLLLRKSMPEKIKCREIDSPYHLERYKLAKLHKKLEKRPKLGWL